MAETQEGVTLIAFAALLAILIHTRLRPATTRLKEDCFGHYDLG